MRLVLSCVLASLGQHAISFSPKLIRHSLRTQKNSVVSLRSRTLEELEGELAYIEALEARNEAQKDSFVSTEAQWLAQSEEDRYWLSKKDAVVAEIEAVMRKEPITSSDSSEATKDLGTSDSFATFSPVATSAVILALFSAEPSLAAIPPHLLPDLVPSGVSLLSSHHGLDPSLIEAQKELPSMLLSKASKGTDPELAVALVLPLATFKAASFARGQQLLWYLDASIWLAIVAAYENVINSF